MITKEEAYRIINGMNDDAHAYAYDEWVKADEMEDDEDAEDQRCKASELQQEFFIEMFDQLDPKTQNAIFHYRDTDESFKMDFEAWYGEE